MRGKRILVVVPVALVVGCGSSSGVLIGASTSSAPPASVPTLCDGPGCDDGSPLPTDTPTPSPTSTGPDFLQPGDSESFTINGATAGTVTVSPVSTETVTTDGIETPQNGLYLVATVTIVADKSLPAQFPVNPLYFYVKSVDGAHYDATFTSDTPALAAIELNAGETTTGKVEFDVPPAVVHGAIVYAPADNPLAQWSF